jgi:hypothetical protein
MSIVSLTSSDASSGNTLGYTTTKYLSLRSNFLTSVERPKPSPEEATIESSIASPLFFALRFT